MLNLNYLKRLGLHGSRLLWRVFMILVPVIGYSFWQALKEMLASSSDDQHQAGEEWGEYADGSPWYSNISHPQWSAYYGDDRRKF